jgi:PAS domain S-box-containing protein
MKTKNKIWISIIWILLITSSYSWNYYYIIFNTSKLVKNKAQSFYNQVLASRLWDSSHGAVYSLVSEQTNPILIDSLMDITTLNSYAHSEINKSENDLHFHITGLNPLRQDDMADEWETKALKSFGNDKPDILELVKSDSSSLYRYMAPLLTSKSCLKCHAVQGYNLGDILGGISISFPSKIYDSANKRQLSYVFLVHFLLLTVGLYGIFRFFEMSKKFFAIIEQKNKKLESDIAKRKLVDEALQNERLLLRTLIDNIPDSIYSKDISCRKTLANLAEVHNVGAKSESEILGKDDFDTHPKELAEKFFADDQSVMQTGKPVVNREEYIIDRNGQKQWLLTSKIPLQDQDGRIIGLVGIGRDITLRRKAEEELIFSMSLLNAALDSTADGILVVDKGGKVTRYNQKFADMWKIPKELLVSKDEKNLLNYIIVQMINPDQFLAKVMELYGHPDESSFDLLDLSEGRIFERYSQPQRIGDDIVGRVWSFRDISRRKQTEEALIESEKKFRTVIEEAIEIVYTINNKGYFTYINPAGLKLSGYSVDELKQLRYIDIIDPEYKQIVKKKFLKQYIERSPLSFTEYPFRTKTGETKWFSQNVRLIVEKGEVQGFYIISRDITDRRIAENALKESETKFRILTETTSSAIFWFSKEKIIYANPASEKLFGFSYQEILELNFLDIVHPDFKDLVIQKSFVNQKDGTAPLRYEIKIINKGGEERWIDFTSGAILYEDKRVILGTAFDITDRKLAETEIKLKNEQLTLADSDKDRLMSILAHDLRSPFNALLGLSELLTQNIRKYDIDKIEKLVNHIYKSAQNTYNLLDDLLLWARSQSGKIPYEPQNLRLADICKDIVENLELNADTKNITINHFVTDEMNIFADIDMLKTILRNLISNAIKFTNIGGQINIRCEQTNSKITISVSDNGVGIAAEVIDKLFEISHIHTTKGTSNESGTGLGLLLCKEFVEKHGGEIWAESEEGKGSTFYFTIPYKHGTATLNSQ